jgi:hypothetical protein
MCIPQQRFINLCYFLHLEPKVNVLISLVVIARIHGASLNPIYQGWYDSVFPKHFYPLISGHENILMEPQN